MVLERRGKRQKSGSREFPGNFPMNGNLEKIGLFGGSFDPIHNGHMALAERAVDFAGLDRVLFIPTANPPHKVGRELTGFGLRRKMVQLAIEDNPRYEISLFEKKDRISYTYESVEHFRDRGYARDKLHYLMGGDSLGEITDWMHPEIIFRHATIISLSRPGYRELYPFPPDAAVMVLNRGKCDISSTGVREAARKGRPIDDMVPDAVAEFIRENSLYRKG
ncbi:MAG: nicotinate (nicotinamide) nucleotide adenylyltransferase [Candidatus Latescibacteria bacterium]|nr:nicotinate (nicotinamide) nucleotide adenylyltransferase [bacterium]MBD3423954.1 nicotinate (nicotinamide) nucleotide adenylyltransferase [Candidatus Latescibacterota bacterium]